VGVDTATGAAPIDDAAGALDGEGRVTCAEAGLAPTGDATVADGGTPAGGPSTAAGTCAVGSPVAGVRSEAIGGAGETGWADTASALGDPVLAQATAATENANRATRGRTRQVMEVAMIHRLRARGETGHRPPHVPGYSVHRMYTVREVATVLGVKPSRLRGYLRAGLVSPQRGARGELRFSFQDLVLLRKAEGLVGSRIAPRRVHDALLRTRAHLGDDVPLSGVQFEADGQSIVASDGQQRWEPTSGQVVFDFQAPHAASGSGTGQLHELRQPKPAVSVANDLIDAPELNADQHYERGYALEEGGNDAAAMEEYRRSLVRDPAHADAHVNLGRLLHEAGKPFDALEHYRSALVTRPGDGTAAFNLGVALEE
jgi:hypothetical protein